MEVALRKTYLVPLSDNARTQLRALLRKGQSAARRIARAQIVLLVDEGHGEAASARSVHVGALTVHRVRRRYAEAGVDAALGEGPRPGGQPKRDGNQEALLVARTCSEPPQERPPWTMPLLADRMVAIGAVDTISDETVRRVIKTTRASRG